MTSVIIMSIAISFNSVHGQSSSSTNARNYAAWFLGWDGTAGSAGTVRCQNKLDKTGHNLM